MLLLLLIRRLIKYFTEMKENNMCGLLFFKSRKEIDREQVAQALKKQEWRGPDSFGIKRCGSAFLAHQRLSILELSGAADQPMTSRCGNFTIIFNGEIYNHIDLRKKLGLACKTSSDTETIVEGFSAIGPAIFDLLDGMFSIVLVDARSDNWWVARDRLGIKPLFMYEGDGDVIISSETISIRSLVSCRVSSDSVEEWKLIRRPVPGYTYFTEISEILPGTVLHNGQKIRDLTIPARSELQNEFNQHYVEDLIKKSVSNHELSDVDNVCLLSGGIDSSIITALSTAKKAYTVGLPSNNEFSAAAETANLLGKDLVSIQIDEDTLQASWRHLIDLRGEPLSVPNEGLIYLVCKEMQPSEKVVLTGEGADELFFGYDRIFRAATIDAESFTKDKFYSLYNYSGDIQRAPRLEEYVENLWHGKSNIDFIEDFFLKVHLPGLLRRMDGASMAASKEARVPFVTIELAQYMYRRHFMEKIDSYTSKIPLRKLAETLKLNGALSRPKIGFSSTLNKQSGRNDEYEFFRKVNLETLGWL